ncbi:hypothetical protein [Methylobacter tundripaludum]|uniref:hypothetical protein n=1 Tax=Methylobacter tundripaludum TaxID=173365 RepID=UPI003F57A321
MGDVNAKNYEGVFIPLSKSGRCNSTIVEIELVVNAFSSRYQSPGGATVPLQAVALQAKFRLFAAHLVKNSAATLKNGRKPEQNENSFYKSTYGALYLDFLASC